MYILNDFLQIKAPTSIILYIIEIRKKSSIEWCKELTPSDRSFRIADWRYLDLTKMQCREEKQIYDLLANKAQEKNEAIDVREGCWKVIGGRGKKRIVFSKK